MARKYDESSISVLSPVEAIRKRPGRFIGEPDSHGMTHLVYEVLDNTVDEWMAGRNTLAEVALRGNEIWVGDAGQGIPTGIHPKTGISTLTTIFTMTNAGGKLGSDAYDRSGGTHGEGVTIVTALSETLDVWTTYKKKVWHIAFVKGEPQGVAKIVKSLPKLPDGMRSTGTIVRWTPDKSVFLKGSHILKDAIRDRCEIASFVNPTLEIRYSPSAGEWEDFYNEDGLYALSAKRYADAGIEPAAMFTYWDDYVDMALAFHTEPNLAVHSEYYTNSIVNPLGGRHAETFWKGIYDALTPLCNGHMYTLKELPVYFSCVLNAAMKEPQFNTQTKEKLIDERGKLFLDGFTAEFTKWCKHKDNNATVMAMLDSMHELWESRYDTKASKDLEKDIKNASGKIMLPGKLAMAPYAKPSERELYLVEGDSASGPSKLAREKGYQEILALRGKPLNACQKSWDKAVANKEIFDIMVAIGYRPAQEDPYANLRISKLIIFSDGDTDGLHISLLLLGMCVQLFPDLLRRGMVYTVDTPEYAAYKNREPTLTADSLPELQALIGKKTGYRVQHHKGLGEMQTKLLKEVAFDPTTRRLRQITLDDAESDLQAFYDILGPDGTVRKQLVGTDVPDI